jgi:DNA-binding protein HU-beta
MLKKDLVSALAEKVDMKKKDAEVVVDALIEALTETLVRGEEVNLFGFAKFIVKETAPRKGRNPQTNEEILIPSKKKVVFKSTKSLLDAMNN